MPTYRNKTGEVLGKPGGVSFMPGETKAVTRIYDDDLRLVKISDEPFYNPIIKVDNIEFNGENDNKEIEIDYTGVPVIVIQKLRSCDIKVYINSLSNEPALPVGEGEKLNLRTFRTISKIILVPSEAGSCTIVQKLEREQGTASYA
ncbi:MAG: hypothetical protein H8D97_01055 [Proteobacteria bacterium]|nr:hypothetical protein [Pseudomonadota bacterium]